MTHSGAWTDGITGDDNWWNNWADASDFLRAMKANVGRTCDAPKETP